MIYERSWLIVGNATHKFLTERRSTASSSVVQKRNSLLLNTIMCYFGTPDSRPRDQIWWNVPQMMGKYPNKRCTGRSRLMFVNVCVSARVCMCVQCVRMNYCELVRVILARVVRPHTRALLRSVIESVLQIQKDYQMVPGCVQEWY